MKKIICILAAFVLCFSLLPGMAATPMQITVGEVDVNHGVAEAVVKIDVANNPGTALIGFKVNYDRSAMALKSAVLGSGFVGTYESNIDSFPFEFTLYNTSGMTANGTLLTLTFQLDANCMPGRYAVELSNVEIANIDELAVEHTVENGYVNVKAKDMTGLSFANKTFTYDGTEKSIAVSGVPTGAVVTYTSEDTTENKATNAGTYNITATVTKNGFNPWTKNAVLTISPKTLTVSGLTAANKTYDGTKTAAISGGTLVGKVSSDDVSVEFPTEGTFAKAGVGNKIAVSIPALVLSGSDKDNYTLTQPANLSANITKAPISIKADDKTMRMGDAVPELTFTITSGQLFGLDEVTGTLSTSANGTKAGIFDINKGTLNVNANYNLTFTKGTLTVVDKTPQQITVSDITAKTYGDAPFAVTVTPDEASGLTVFTFASSNPAVATIDGSGNITIKGAGTTDITVSQAGNADYAPFKRKQTLTVNKVAITVTADAKTKKIGTADPALTYTYTGTLVGDDAFSGALTRKAGETIGRYDILQGTLTLGNNYAITYQKAIFEIVDKTPQNIVVADIPAKTYGDAPFALSVTQDSTANLTAFTYTSGDETVATVDAAGNVTIVGAGETTITVNEAGNADYAAFSATKQLVVAKKAVAVTSVNLDEKTAVLEGVLPGDTAVELDFDAVALEITGAVDETTSNAVVTNFVLKGEKAENYIVSTESLDTTVTTANTASVSIVAGNGTAVGAGTYLKESNVTVSVTANSGYKFAGWYVGEEKVSANAEYTFVIDGDVELEAKFTKKSSGGGGATLPGAQKPAEPTPVEPSEPAEPSESEDPVSGEPAENGAAAFTDVDKETYAWAYDGIDALAKAGVFKGMTPTTFGPELTTTNAQVIALAVRIAGLKAADGATTDLVADDHWVYAEMTAADKAGILGVFGGKVAVEEATTREVAFTLLYSALKAAGVVLPETAEAIEYTDASSIDAACVEAITALTKAGIVNGMGDGTLQPKATVTRAQLAKILGIAQTLIK